jgi:hypothetical protein
MWVVTTIWVVGSLSMFQNNILKRLKETYTYIIDNYG